jgi:DNA-binding MarR family transcriptional regulator
LTSRGGQKRKAAAHDVPYDWTGHSAGKHTADSRKFKQYFHGISEARHVIRKIFRIVDDQAKKVGIEPLEHQTLIQVFGSVDPPRVIDLADRLDISPAFASRLIRSLEDKGLVTRSRSDLDRRTTHVEVTPDGRSLLASIDESVELHVGYFQRQLSDAERAATLGVIAFYLGAPAAGPELDRLLGIGTGTPSPPGAGVKRRGR